MISLLTSRFSNIIPHTVALFAVPSMVTVAEIERTLRVCVTLTAIPSNATLANEAVVSLSTVDGTGIGAIYFYYECSTDHNAFIRLQQVLMMETS